MFMFTRPSSSSFHHLRHTLRWAHMEPTRQKIIVIMGPTGAGKSRLSIDLATRFFKNSEIINSDKMQVYRGLDVTTNKITLEQRCGIPHHLLGSFDPTRSVITPFNFRQLASQKINDIVSRGGLPLLVGGSNSFIYALLEKNFDPKSDVFNGLDPYLVNTELRYKCCFIWVDVSFPVLNQYLCKRVDEMLESGMLEELEEYFGSGENLRVKRAGLGQAIGVPELEGYFNFKDDKEMLLYEEAVRRIKDNTCQLAKRQVWKIQRLKNAGWDLNRIDATEVFRTVDDGGGKVAEIWEKQVVETSVKIVKQFLDE